MKSKVVLACLCGSLLIFWETPAHADDGDNSAQLSGDNAGGKESGPYSAIAARNVFRLNPPPPPPPPPTNDTTAATAGGLKLTGLFKSAGSPVRALFVNVPSNPTNTVYYNLKEGERDGVLELIRINEGDESAEVIHAGMRLTVLLKDSKPVSTGAPGVPAAPGVPGAPGVVPAPKPVVPSPAVASAPVPPPVVNRSAVVGGSSGRGSSAVVSAGGLASFGGTAGIATPGAASADLNTSRNIRANTGWQPQNHEEATTALILDSVAHEEEIKAGKYPPPPPIPGYNYNPPGR